MDEYLNIESISVENLIKTNQFDVFLSVFEKTHNVIFYIEDRNQIFLYKSINYKGNYNEKVEIFLENCLICNIFIFSEYEIEFVKEIIANYFKNLVIQNYKIYLTNNIHLKLIEKDYEELKEKNKLLNETLKSLQEMDIIKSNFLATISHELKTPLTSIIGYSELLQLEDLNEESVENVDKILKNATELLNLIKQILDLSKIEAGAIRLKKEKGNIVNLINDVIENVSYHINGKSIKVNKNINTNILSFSIHFDKEKIFQILRNLVINAIKFSNSNSHIDITINIVDKIVENENPNDENFDFFGNNEKKYIHISIRDYGIGISKHHLAKIFDAFYQVDNSQIRNHGGTGLGLAIVKSFVDAHNGFYGVESELTKGSLFWIELPVDE